MNVPYSGRCACGAITYQCEATPIGMGNCHCRDCQRSSGTSHTSVVVVPSASLTIEGTNLQRYESAADSGTPVYRSFCSQCGSPLFAGNTKFPEFISIKAASLDDPSWFQPAIDIWISSAQPWCLMSPETEKFERDLPMSP